MSTNQPTEFRCRIQFEGKIVAVNVTNLQTLKAKIEERFPAIRGKYFEITYKD